MPFTRRNLKEDLEDLGYRFDGAPDLEFRLATEALELEQSGLGYQRVPPGYRFPYGHTHKKQEEVYVVVRGGGRMKLDDEIVELKERDVVRVSPGTCEATRQGRTVSRSSSSARPISARLLATTSRASATGGPTSPRLAALDGKRSTLGSPLLVACARSERPDRAWIYAKAQVRRRCAAR